MLDLSVVEKRLEDLNLYSEVKGLLRVQDYVKQGFNGATCAMVTPLTTRAKKIGGGTVVEYENLQRFAVVIGLSDGGAIGGGDNAEMANLVLASARALLGISMSDDTGTVDLGNGVRLPSGDTGCVFWQQEFFVTHYLRI